MTATQTLRVGQLRQLLEGLPDETYVVVVASDGWYQNLRVETPATNDELECVTFYQTDEYDSLQWTWDTNPVVETKRLTLEELVSDRDSLERSHTCGEYKSGHKRGQTKWVSEWWHGYHDAIADLVDQLS